jgi:signal transduction histidine kinase
VLEQDDVLVAELIEAAAATHSIAAQKKSIAILKQAPATLEAWLDPAKLKRVLDNLLSNAIKFTAEGGTIEISGGVAKSGELVIAVSDDGCGIPAEHLDRVLEPFGQVEDHLTRENDGVGLGLPIARALVGLHGGVLKILSEEKAGTTVEVRLPAERVRAREHPLAS